ncbi:putative disease resistance protein RGA4 isoform X1 [Diospyros lotus]|uniref:putative disease resistance protein RGA4 isoform X1 n=1 Tax=Diospyros lotus TaxID=55363 RepID=UPI002258ED67|nr:putative disease resistance protein RGA4 isoform X1 [Diospyros lotus]XP_052172463.1 putative disease resistance protein RGA4 isoform X1 [Diospyros lotus]
MEEVFLFNVAELILSKLGGLLIQVLFLANGADTELRKLQIALLSIKLVLLDAEENQSTNVELHKWLAGVKDAFADADDLLDEVEFEALKNQVRGRVWNYLTSRSSITFRLSVVSRIKEMTARLHLIDGGKNNFRLSERSSDRRNVRIQRETSHSFVRSVDVIGRRRDEEAIVERLTDASEHVSVIPIVGIGGLGKTTLARLVYNNEQFAKHFEPKMWVGVSQDFDMNVLMRKIIESATNSACAELGSDHLQHTLRGCLADKKFLLILDDMWDSDLVKWRELKSLLMGGRRGSKVIVTTRSNAVVSIVGSDHPYELGGLAWRDCFSLILEWAFPKGEDQSRHQNLLDIGEQIAVRCRGVPLAARTLGSLLYKKTDERDWQRVRDSEIWRLQGQRQEDILPALKLSYDYLPSYLKPCFAYCSIFQMGQYIYKDKLIQLWMAQGLIQSIPGQNLEPEDIGDQYFDELCSTSLFQEVEENGPLYVTFRMHDLVHDLAQSIAQTECLKKKSHTGDVSNMVRHVSLLGCDLSGQGVEKSLLKLQKLRTIFFPRDGIKSTHDRFVDECISTFLYLRVIDLEDSCFEVLPKSIGYLKHLRFLDLSWNCSIKKLPASICKLLNLQTLRISDCKALKRLPKNIGNLIGLRHLYVTTQQESFPEKAIGCLTSLQSLWITGCANLVCLPEEIQCLRALRTLAISRCPRLASLPKCIASLAKLENLMINDCEKLNLDEGSITAFGNLGIRKMVFAELPNFVNWPHWLRGTAASVNYLRIAYCPSLGELPEWLQYSASLQKLEIFGCPEVSALPEGFQHLRALKVLRVKECSGLAHRLHPETRRDWHMVGHIPELYINNARITSSHY